MSEENPQGGAVDDAETETPATTSPESGRGDRIVVVTPEGMGVAQHDQ